MVTGSTNCIGFGSARALAANGHNIMLNGFGDKSEVEAARAGLVIARLRFDIIRRNALWSNALADLLRRLG